MTLKTTSTFGNFRWNAEAEVTDEQASILAAAGLLQVLQRSPASKAEKALAGYEKRPENFQRSSIAFSDEAASTLQMELEKPVEIAEGVTIEAAIEVSEHVIGESTLPKFVEEKQIVARHIDKGDFAQWMKENVGFPATAADADSTEVLQAVKAYKTKLLKTA